MNKQCFFALYDASWVVRNQYWTWYSDAIPEALRRKLATKTVAFSQRPEHSNRLTPDDVVGGIVRLENWLVVYRYFNGGRDTFGRPDRFVIMSAWVPVETLDRLTAAEACWNDKQTFANLYQLLYSPEFLTVRDQAPTSLPIPPLPVLSRELPCDNSNCEVWRKRWAKTAFINGKNDIQTLGAGLTAMATLGAAELHYRINIEGEREMASLEMPTDFQPPQKIIPKPIQPPQIPYPQECRRNSGNSGNFDHNNSQSQTQSWQLYVVGGAIALLIMLIVCLGTILFMIMSNSKKEDVNATFPATEAVPIVGTPGITDATKAFRLNSKEMRTIALYYLNDLYLDDAPEKAAFWFRQSGSCDVTSMQEIGLQFLEHAQSNSASADNGERSGPKTEKTPEYYLSAANEWFAWAKELKGEENAKTAIVAEKMWNDPRLVEFRKSQMFTPSATSNNAEDAENVGTAKATEAAGTAEAVETAETTEAAETVPSGDPTKPGWETVGDAEDVVVPDVVGGTPERVQSYGYGDAEDGSIREMQTGKRETSGPYTNRINQR